MIVFLIFIAIIIILIVVLRKRKKRLLLFVDENSKALKELRTINNDFYFYNVNCFTEKHTYDNKNFYDNISCQDYLIYQLQFKAGEVLQNIRKVKANNEKYDIYFKKISNIDCFGDFNKPIKKYDKKKALEIEKKLFKQNIKNPLLKYEIKVILYCSYINGKLYRVKSDVFDVEQIERLIKKLNNKYNNYYKDRYIWDAICRVERGRVSNKMRFAIYKRDGYRCLKCGRTGVNNLEIDHIKPIAKGGKSTYDNLQTLCKRCNKEKGDTYF